MKLLTLMIKKPGSYRLLIDYILLVLVYSLLILILLNSHTPRSDSFVAPALNIAVDKPASSVRHGVPVILEIPSINLYAPIEQISLTLDGSLATPIGESNVGWYRLGPRPGELGSAVIDGHFGQWEDGSGSVFDDLNKLLRGDKVYTIDDQGNTISFVVRDIRSYDPATIAPEVFNSSDGLAHLNLITCQGDWVDAGKTFTSRLVVFTDKIIL